MADLYEKYSNSLDSPCVNGFAITPSDVADLPCATRYLYLGHNDHSESHAYCTVRVTMLGGAILTLTKLQHGQLYPFRIAKVWATGSDTDNLFGFY